MRILTLLLPGLFAAGVAGPEAENTLHIAPPYADAPEMLAQPRRSKGTLHSFIMHSGTAGSIPASGSSTMK